MKNYYIFISFSATPKICNTSGCLLAASQIVAHIDPTVNPCDDFFKFACGKFIQQAHGDINAASVKKIERQVERQLAEIIKEPIKDEDNYWIKNQKILLQACMNESAVGEETMQEFEEILEDLNGWPIVTGHKWNEGIFDWKEILYKLKDRGYTNSMLLEVTVIEDRFNNTNRHIVLILPPYLKKVDNEHKDILKRFMTNVAVKFGADRNRAAIEMEKVMDFMENLQKITDEKDAKVKNNTQFNRTAEILKTRFTVGTYQELNGDIDWLDFINRFLEPVARVTSDDYVVFPKLEYTEAFFRLINKISKR
ncbi:hypothetical protein ILUMI_21608 [Ignelater luminosus]|uniref:Peptidase M13 N-terminal domain-containing protein n=1 Tax=Ignelater luminosus TaxID=2038154 RepID=A0A8K0CE94_IGNLU|nr:hypothetical protein ILUMI_21608 [Ignelater luminosus]